MFSCSSRLIINRVQRSWWETPQLGCSLLDGWNGSWWVGTLQMLKGRLLCSIRSENPGDNAVIALWCCCGCWFTRWFPLGVEDSWNSEWDPGLWWELWSVNISIFERESLRRSVPLLAPTASFILHRMKRCLDLILPNEVYWLIHYSLPCKLSSKEIQHEYCCLFWIFRPLSKQNVYFFGNIRSQF